MGSKFDKPLLERLERYKDKENGNYYIIIRSRSLRGYTPITNQDHEYYKIVIGFDKREYFNTWIDKYKFIEGKWFNEKINYEEDLKFTSFMVRTRRETYPMAGITIKRYFVNPKKDFFDSSPELHIVKECLQRLGVISSN